MNWKGIIDVRLESATRSLHMQAPQGVLLESQAGDISATCYEDLQLRSTGGSVKLINLSINPLTKTIEFFLGNKIKLDSANVMLTNIRTAIVTAKSQRPAGIGQSRSSVQIYQVFNQISAPLISDGAKRGNPAIFTAVILTFTDYLWRTRCACAATAVCSCRLRTGRA